MTRSLHMCCAPDAIVAYWDGQFWFRRPTWLAGKWAPQGTPPTATKRRRSGAATETRQRRARR